MSMRKPARNCGLDHARIRDFRMENNQFTNHFPTFVQPMGTTVTKRIEVRADKTSYRVGFHEEIPVGNLTRAQIELAPLAKGCPRAPIVRRLLKHSVEFETPDPFDGEIFVTATALRESARFPYVVA